MIRPLPAQLSLSLSLSLSLPDGAEVATDNQKRPSTIFVVVSFLVYSICFIFVVIVALLTAAPPLGATTHQLIGGGVNRWRHGGPIPSFTGRKME